MLEGAGEIDAIVISTTAPPRLGIAGAVLSRGFAGKLLLEKPISYSVSEARSFRSSADGRLGDIRIDYNRRAAAFYREIREAVESGRIGPLRAIEYNRPCKLNMKASHQIDLVNWLLAVRPLAVRAELEEVSAVDHLSLIHI